MSDGNIEFIEVDRKSTPEEIEQHQAFLIDLMKQGKDAWNKWRDAQPDTHLNLSGVDFTASGHNITEFSGFHFGNYIYFMEATFGNDIKFIKATFGIKIYFNEATFGNDINFHQATFGNDIYFDGVTKSYNFNLSETKFKSVPSFTLQSEDDKVGFNLTSATFALDKPVSTNTISNLQVLKSIADATASVNESRDLFILQREAERALHWEALKAHPRKPDPDKKMQPWIKSLITHFSRSMQSTVLTSVFWLIADYGRSALYPLLWWIASVVGFKNINDWMYDKPITVNRQGDLLDYTLSNSIPFGKLLNPDFEQAVRDLFGRYQTVYVDGIAHIVNVVEIPLKFHLVGMLHSVISVILLFLIGLAIRNFFKIG